MPRQAATVVAPTATAAPDRSTSSTVEEADPPDAEAFRAPRQRILLEPQVSSPTPVPTVEILPAPAEPTRLRLPSIGFDEPAVGALPSQASPPTPVPTREVLPTPAEPTHLLIPSIGLDTPVVEVFPAGDTWESAEYAAGYMHGTARAGEAGNMAISGHLGLRGGVFANLAAVQPGADIFVDAAGWRYHYRMRGSQVVWPNQIEVLFPEETTTLTLITCTNWDTQRLIVTADLLEWQLIGAQ
jgi:sortase A